ncbi:MAG: zinc-dependent metalloprotease [Acidimicrobiia bacterium]|nr:zinc-dependent metalloprotease [Acidimicrobiia bacterium]
MSKDVDWDFARSVAERIANRESSYDHPSEAEAMESDFLELTTQAEALVAAETGLTSLAGPAKARVTDRMGWVDANLASFDRLLRPLIGRLADEAESDEETQSEAASLLDSVYDALGPWAELIKPTVTAIGETVGGAVNGATAYIGPKVAGAEVGALLGWMSGRVLGQYDLLIIEDERPEDQDWVYYVGPNIAGLEKRYNFDARQFRLWIAIHECTHRAQFTAVRWLRPYFLSLVNELLDSVDPDPKRVMETVREVINDRRNGNGLSLKDGGLSVLLATPEQRAVLDKVTGLMSLLEGHGDITMDRAAGDLIPSQGRFHQVMSERRKSASGLSKLIHRLTGMEAKLAQYEEGEAFVKTVEAAGGRELFGQVWVGPENLPSIDEIRDPDLWIARMGASSAV